LGVQEEEKWDENKAKNVMIMEIERDRVLKGRRQ